MEWDKGPRSAKPRGCADRGRRGALTPFTCSESLEAAPALGLGPGQWHDHPPSRLKGVAARQRALPRKCPSRPAVQPRRCELGCFWFRCRQASSRRRAETRRKGNAQRSVAQQLDFPSLPPQYSRPHPRPRPRPYELMRPRARCEPPSSPTPRPSAPSTHNMMAG